MPLCTRGDIIFLRVPIILVFSQWLQITLDFVFPAECLYCGNFLGDTRMVVFCQTCWEQIAVITDPTCALCGDLLPHTQSSRLTAPVLCKHCRESPPWMDRVIAATSYDDVARTAIHQFKFHHKTSLAKPFAHLIHDRLSCDFDMTTYQAILPVPLHPRRRRQRGYNQSEMLARELSQMLHLPLMRGILRRIRQTNEQALLADRPSRHVNIRDAFQVVQPTSVKGKALVLVDDVVTTGATVSECARMLKQAGAESVLVLTIARRVLRRYSHAPTPPGVSTRFG